MHKKIASIAFPLILSNVTVPLLGLVNIGLMGHQLTSYGVAALGIGAMILNFVYSLFHFLRIGTTGMAAIAYGESNESDLIVVLLRSLMVSVMVGWVVVLCFPIVPWVGVHFIHASAAVHQAVIGYVEIRVFAVPPALFNLSLMGFFVGVQRPSWALVLSLTSTLVALVTGVVLVLGVHLSLSGIAFADIIAQYSTTLLGGVLCCRYLKGKSVGPKHWRELVSWAAVIPYFKLNADMFIRSLCLIGCLSLFTVMSARFGTVVLAANTLLLSVQAFTSHALDGVANAAETLVGASFGGRQNQRCYQVLKATLWWTVIFTVAFILLYGFGGRRLILSLTSLMSVYDQVLHHWDCFLVITVVSCFSYWLDGVFVGLLETRVMRNSMVLSTLVFAVLMRFLFPLGEVGVLWALLGFFVLRCLTLGQKLMKFMGQLRGAALLV